MVTSDQNTALCLEHLNHLKDRLQTLHDVMQRNHVDRIHSPDSNKFPDGSLLGEINCIIGNVKSVRDEVEKLSMER